MQSELTKELLGICGPKFESEHSMEDQFGIDNLTKEQRIEVEQKLIEHFGFRKVVWMTLPSGLTEDGEPIVAKTYKIEGEAIDFTGKVGYVYKILFTPKMYEPNALHTPVKDGCVISPVMYNPATFFPKRSITLEWSPEFPQDINSTRTWEDDKKIIHDMLEKVLENPEEYMPEGFRYGLLRFAAV